MSENEIVILAGGPSASILAKCVLLIVGFGIGRYVWNLKGNFNSVQSSSL